MPYPTYFSHEKIFGEPSKSYDIVEHDGLLGVEFLAQD